MVRRGDARSSLSSSFVTLSPSLLLSLVDGLMFAVEFCDSDDRNQQPTRDSASSERKLWASYGPVPESAPSETSVNLEKHTVASSLTHSPDFVHVLRAFYDAPSTDCDLLSAARDIWWSLVNRSGIMANACEMTITAALTAMLSKHLVRQVGQYWSTTWRAHAHTSRTRQCAL